MVHSIALMVVKILLFCRAELVEAQNKRLKRTAGIGCPDKSQTDRFNFLTLSLPPIVLWYEPKIHGRTSPHIAVPANNICQDRRHSTGF